MSSSHNQRPTEQYRVERDADTGTHRRERPLSPHLQIYRLPLTALVSILHRITGVVLSVGALLGVVCLFALAEGPSSYEGLRAIVSTAIGQSLVWLWIAAFYLHLSHGIRHLLWDIGYGFAHERLNRAIHFELGLTAGLTLFTAVWNRCG